MLFFYFFSPYCIICNYLYKNRVLTFVMLNVSCIAEFAIMQTIEY